MTPWVGKCILVTELSKRVITECTPTRATVMGVSDCTNVTKRFDNSVITLLLYNL
jgi:hypothetical protein